jgi:uncharacterized protein
LTFIPDLIWLGPAFFYGGVTQLLAGMWEFRNRNVFGATVFGTYGSFWLSLGTFAILITLSKNFASAITANPGNVNNAEAWFLVAFAIFNIYMLAWSTKVNEAVFAVLLALQVTEILLAVGNFMEAHGHTNSGWIHAGGWAGIVTAGFAWYTSAAGVINGMSAPRVILPVGGPLWKQRAMAPAPRERHA